MRSVERENSACPVPRAALSLFLFSLYLSFLVPHSSLTCSAIDYTGGRAPSHRTSSFPLDRSCSWPLRLTSSISLGSTVLAPSSLSVLSPFHHQIRNFPVSLPLGASPTLKSIRSCESCTQQTKMDSFCSCQSQILIF